MASQFEELPLFPLNTVLFPYAKLQLNVSDERHREMLRQCMQSDSAFGIVLTKNSPGGEDEHYLVGTRARIVSVQTFDDGHMDVQVAGEGRFRIRRVDESRRYAVGLVEPIVESEVADEPKTDALVYRIKECLTEYMGAVFSGADLHVSEIRLPDDATALSFVIANFLQIENIQKQGLLETTDTVERISEMLPILEQHTVDATVVRPVQLTVQDLEEWVGPN